MSVPQLAVLLFVVLAIPAVSVLCVWLGVRAVLWSRRNRAQAASIALSTYGNGSLDGPGGSFEDGWESFRTKLGDWLDSVAENDSGGSGAGGGSDAGEDAGGDGGGE